MAPQRLCCWDDKPVPRGRGRDRFCSEECRRAHRDYDGHRATAPSEPRFEPSDVAEIHLDARALRELIEQHDVSAMTGSVLGESWHDGGLPAPRVDDQSEWQNSWWSRSSRERP